MYFLKVPIDLRIQIGTEGLVAKFYLCQIGSVCFTTLLADTRLVELIDSSTDG